MLLYPDVQKSAQQELDKTLGGSRIPSSTELASLPYLHALVLEVLRWHTVASIGSYTLPYCIDTVTDQTDLLDIPHAALKDDIFLSYHIPKGTVILANLQYVSFPICNHATSDSFICMQGIRS